MLRLVETSQGLWKGCSSEGTALGQSQRSLGRGSREWMAFSLSWAWTARGGGRGKPPGLSSPLALPWGKYGGRWGSGDPPLSSESSHPTQQPLSTPFIDGETMARRGCFATAPASERGARCYPCSQVGVLSPGGLEREGSSRTPPHHTQTTEHTAPPCPVTIQTLLGAPPQPPACT